MLDHFPEEEEMEPVENPVPKLDFSGMKSIKRVDWYAQCKRLELVIIFLRNKVENLESELDKNHSEYVKYQKAMQGLIEKIKQSNQSV